MMEEIDMDLSRVYEAMDEGFKIINRDLKEKQKERSRVEIWENDLRLHLYERIMPVLRSYVRCLDVHYPENCNYPRISISELPPDEYGGWFEVKIPDFALMAFHINLSGEKSYFVFNPAKIQEGLQPDHDWHELAIHRNVADYRLALALAKQAWEHYVKTADGPVEMSAGEGHPEAEVYEPVDGEGGPFQIDEGYIQLMIDQRLKHYGLI